MKDVCGGDEDRKCVYSERGRTETRNRVSKTRKSQVESTMEETFRRVLGNVDCSEGRRWSKCQE